jgi:uncharacterized protein involved in exopolysaccharide biosynthesis
MGFLLDSKDRAPLSDFVGLLRLRWALIFMVVSLALLTTLVVTAMLPRWYLSTAKIRVEKPEGEVKLFQTQSSTYYDPYFIQDQFETIQSQKILAPVIEHLGLAAVLGQELNNGQPLPADTAYRYVVDRMLRVESRHGTSVIEINVYARDIALAPRVANEIAKVYSEDRISFATSDSARGWMSSRSSWRRRRTRSRSSGIWSRSCARI